ncbi:nucleolar and coiled-body phosphoprotein 1-like [Neocloeon triangulifer]|uniref:nucleolar and coiled-body phosphoprotein 1-like n=1 Tax=Neocloeon triangulifer TaxID=2078957 RepID=UPI00286F98C2|nr:nucleolar and coiled-body phosphoprotein 1-like [Neocloeon triangulifer]
MIKVIFSIGIAFLAITFNARAAPVESTNLQTRMSVPKVVEQTKEMSPQAIPSIPTGYQISSNGVDKAAFDTAMKTGLVIPDAAALMGMQSVSGPDKSILGSMNLPPGLPDNYKNILANMQPAGTVQDGTPPKTNIPIPSDSSKTADGANAVQPTAQKKIDSDKEKVPERAAVITKDIKSDTKPLQLASPSGAPIDPIASNDASKAKLAAQEKNADKTVLSAKDKPEDANAKKATAGGETSVKLKTEEKVNTEPKEVSATKPDPGSTDKIAVLKTADAPPPPAGKTDTDTAAKKPSDGKSNGEMKPLHIDTYKQPGAKDQPKPSSSGTGNQANPEVGNPQGATNGGNSDAKLLPADGSKPSRMKDQSKKSSSGGTGNQANPEVGNPQGDTNGGNSDAKPLQADGSKPSRMKDQSKKSSSGGTGNQANPEVGNPQGDTNGANSDAKPLSADGSKPARTKDQSKKSSGGKGNQANPEVLGNPQVDTNGGNSDAKPLPTDGSKPARAKDQPNKSSSGAENQAKQAVLSSLGKPQIDKNGAKSSDAKTWPTGANKPAGSKDQSKTASSGTGNQAKTQSAISSSTDPKQQVANKQKDSPSKSSNSSRAKQVPGNRKVPKNNNAGTSAKAGTSANAGTSA